MDHAAPGHVDSRPNLCPEGRGAQESAGCECLALRAPCLCLCQQPEPGRAKCLCLCLELVPQAGAGPAPGRVLAPLPLPAFPSYDHGTAFPFRPSTHAGQQATAQTSQGMKYTFRGGAERAKPQQSANCLGPLAFLQP